jgi:hypothetical protein
VWTSRYNFNKRSLYICAIAQTPVQHCDNSPVSSENEAHSCRSYWFRGGRGRSSGTAEQIRHLDAALTRKVVPVPEYAGPEADTSKLQSVLLEDWETPYPQNVIDHLKGADACVWSVVSPARVCCAEKLMLHQVSCDNADKVQRHELR